VATANRPMHRWRVRGDDADVLHMGNALFYCVRASEQPAPHRRTRSAGLKIQIERHVWFGWAISVVVPMGSVLLSASECLQFSVAEARDSRNKNSVGLEYRKGFQFVSSSFDLDVHRGQAHAASVRGWGN